MVSDATFPVQQLLICLSLEIIVLPTTVNGPYRSDSASNPIGIRDDQCYPFTHHSLLKGATLAKPNYQYEKRQRDLSKKKKQEEKQEEKRQRKLDKSNASPDETPNQ